MRCEKCKFAKWDKTKTGCLHPLGGGVCTWSVTLPIAASCRSYIAPSPYHTTDQKRGIRDEGGGVFTLGDPEGQFISRKRGKETPMYECPVFEEKEVKGLKRENKERIE